MRNPKTLGAVIILVLLATTIVQIPVYGPPVEPTSYKEEKCWSGKRCIDPGYYDYIHECLIEAGRPGTCAQAIVVITCTVGLATWGTYNVVKWPGPTSIKVIVITMIWSLTYITVKREYEACFEAAEAALNYIKENCYYSK